MTVLFVSSSAFYTFPASTCYSFRYYYYYYSLIKSYYYHHYFSST